jgi:hypothetical protein
VTSHSDNDFLLINAMEYCLESEKGSQDRAHDGLSRIPSFLLTVTRFASAMKDNGSAYRPSRFRVREKSLVASITRSLRHSPSSLVPDERGREREKKESVASH